ncbi:conserved unknown protein [Ectocarpus siliculosus]|uniref:Uncharacterized protein n=1 Tax=Ectocarpus siliculosus TaxID=2880 RepID=D8LJQ0_ECTSI|nr:conserved unknown protein [Ectocarpus siliculosus]|eukprot:CBN77077.1 conserved unknown protein [Ectocarpus siliculosus]
MTQTFHEQRVLAPEATGQWLWIVSVASLGALCAALGIGANDVANSFATSVGSKALTLKKALLLAGICEFFGALLLGRQAMTAISESIADDEAWGRTFTCVQADSKYLRDPT